MYTPAMETSIKSPSTKRAGRRLRYGVRTIQFPLYMPPELRHLLEREALSRNVREGKPNAWNAGNVAVDWLMERVGMERSEGEGNGRV